MKITKVLCISLMTIILPSWASPSTHADLEALRNASTFALGQVGFIGHISESEHRYRRLLQAPAALDHFIQLINDESATNEGRLYAACGLRILAAARFQTLTRKLRESGGSVSVLRTDILNREPVRDHLQTIARHGCADAHWR